MSGLTSLPRPAGAEVIPLAQVQVLAGVLPGLVVHQRGAYLGVGTSSNATECEIGEVKHGGPADKAGLQAGDVVIEFDDHQIDQFSDLVGVLQEYKPGTTAQVTVLRHGRSLELPVEVEAWHFAPVAEDPQDRLMLPPPNAPRPAFPAPGPPLPRP